MTAEKLALNLKSAQNLARVKAGLPPDSARADNELSYTERAAYNKALAGIIAANPSAFTARLAETAADVTAKTYEPLTSPSLGESVNVFATEVGSQAVKLNDSLNPLSENNRAGTATTLKWILIVVALGAAAVYLGPALMEGGQKLRAAGRRSTAK